MLIISYVMRLHHRRLSNRNIAVYQTYFDWLLLIERTLFQTATYVSEYIASRMATEQLKSYGQPCVTLEYPSNLQVINLVITKQLWTVISTPPLNLTSCVFFSPIIGWGMQIAVHVLHFIFIPGSISSADFLSKNGYIKPSGPCSFWEGDTVWIE